MDALYFDLTATRAYLALILRRVFLGPIATIVYMLVFLTFATHLTRTSEWEPLILSMLLVGFAVSIIHGFITDKLEAEDAAPLEGRNIAHLLAADVVRQLKHPANVTPLDLLHASLASPRGVFVLQEMGIDAASVYDRCADEAKSIELLTFVREAGSLLAFFGQRKLSAAILLYAFLKRDGAFGAVLNTSDLSLEDLQRIVRWEAFHERAVLKNKGWSSERLLRAFGSFGRSWIMGYNNALDLLTTDLSERAFASGPRATLVHGEQLDAVLRVLTHADQHNVVLIGRPGTGRKGLVHNLAQQLRRNEVEHHLPYTRVLLLNVQQLLSGTINPDIVLLKALNQAASEAGRFVLVIHDLGLLLRTSDAHIKTVLSKFLHSPNISFLAVSDPVEYHSTLKMDPALDAQFEKVTLEDASDPECVAVLMEEYFALEHAQHVHVPYRILRLIVELSRRYIGSKALPGKAVDVLRDSMLTARQAGERVVAEEHVRSVVSLKAHMNVQKVTGDERDALLHLEEKLLGKIIGQERACTALVSALKRARADLGESKRPLGTFLFLGPTGVGKTETAKVLAKEYFGSVDSFIRVDMNEYGSAESVWNIIGTPDGNAFAEGFLTKRVQDRPFSLVLLDEIEKAHPQVLNLFLQILDEGQLIDGRGLKTDFRNTIIIATSNAGALFIRDYVAAHPSATAESHEPFKKALVDELLHQRTFSPEFLNRFDEVIVYEPLTQEEATKVAILMLDSIIREILERKGVKVLIDEEALRAVVGRGYSAEFGAREMRRAITEAIETHLADVFLKQDIKRGDVVAIHASDLSF